MTLHFSSWLRKIDPSGTLDCYLPVLEEHCEESDFQSKYIIVESGQPALDPQFFDDLGIENLAHQLLFGKGVSKSAFSPLPRNASGPHSSELTLVGIMGAIHASAENVSAELSMEKVAEPSKPTTKTAATMDFAEWLKKVDPVGGLDCYLPALEENYDVEDMERLWSDGRFFEDLKIIVPEHQQTFAKFFTRSTTSVPSH